MKRSFFRKLLLGSLAILVFSFLVQWIFQQLWIEQALLSRAQSQIEEVLATLEDQPTSTELQQMMDTLTTSTGSLTSVINLNEVQQQTIQLATITIESDGVEYKILRPRSATGSVRVGLAVQGSFYASSVADVFVPLELTIGTRQLFGNQLSMSFSPELFQQLGVDTSTRYILNGTITGTNDVIVQDTQQVLYNSELLNLMSQSNITELQQTDLWTRYQSLDELGNPLNLVYVTPVDVAQESLILLTVYPLGTTRIITQSLYVISLISLIGALIITGLLYGWFFQRVSVPLQEVNKATKRFSLLDFTPIAVPQSNDEIEDLSNNINILSATLSTTLAELEDRNGLLLDQLEQERLSEQRREELIAGISHELKTPLAILQASIEAISLGFIDESEISMYQENMKTEIAKANQIIMNLLHLQYKEEHQQSVIQPVDMAEIIQSTTSQYQPLMDQRGLTLSQSLTPCTIEASSQKMELVISNLVSNAIKYSAANGVISIQLSESQVTICNATNLPENTDIDSLFFPFYRADKSRSRQDGSTGLGLSIVRQLLEQHQFSYECTIQQGQFCFSILFETTISSDEAS